MQSTTATQPFYVGATDQHDDIINQWARESAILKDQREECETMFKRDKARAIKQITINQDMHSKRDHQLWLVDQITVHRLLEGKYMQKANQLDDERMAEYETRAQHYVEFIRSTYVSNSYRDMSELYQTALEETL